MIDWFSVIFGAAMIGLVVGVGGWAAFGGNAIAGWLLGAAAGLFVGWKLLTEDT